LIEGIQKPFPPGESTFAGRTQALLDSIFGVDKIGLDPGEKPSKSQPSEADISFIDSLIMVPGTTKVTKLTPKKRVELLRKRLEKGNISESEAKNLSRITNELSGIRHRQSKVTPKQSRKDKYLDLIRKKEITSDPQSVMWRDHKLNHEIPWEKPPKNGVMGENVAKGNNDLFHWGQDKHGLTKEYLQKHGKDIKEIRTRSDLIAHDDYIELLPRNAKIKIHLPVGNRLSSKRIESGAPSLKRRIKAGEKLKKAGFDVRFVRDILIHPDRKTGLKMNDDQWEVLKEDVPRGFKIEENRILLDEDRLGRLKKMLGDNIEIKRITESDKFKDRLFPKKPTDLDVIKGKKKKGPSIENKKVKDLTDEEFLERLTTVNKQIEDINKMPDNSVDEDILDNLAKERVRLLDEYRRRQGQSNVKNLDLRKDKPKRGK
jgi:hypothetical protein